MDAFLVPCQVFHLRSHSNTNNHSPDRLPSVNEGEGGLRLTVNMAPDRDSHASHPRATSSPRSSRGARKRRGGRGERRRNNKHQAQEGDGEEEEDEEEWVEEGWEDEEEEKVEGLQRVEQRTDTWSNVDELSMKGNASPLR